jgi:hypothetical protein
VSLLAAADEMEVVDEIMPQVIALINQVKVSGSGRDNIIELLTKFITRKDGVGWSKRFIDVGGPIRTKIETFKIFYVICWLFIVLQNFTVTLWQLIRVSSYAQSDVHVQVFEERWMWRRWCLNTRHCR